MTLLEVYQFIVQVLAVCSVAFIVLVCLATMRNR